MCSSRLGPKAMSLVLQHRVAPLACVASGKDPPLPPHTVLWDDLRNQPPCLAHPTDHRETRPPRTQQSDGTACQCSCLAMASRRGSTLVREMFSAVPLL